MRDGWSMDELLSGLDDIPITAIPAFFAQPAAPGEWAGRPDAIEGWRLVVDGDGSRCENQDATGLVLPPIENVAFCGAARAIRQVFENGFGQIDSIAEPSVTV